MDLQESYGAIVERVVAIAVKGPTGAPRNRVPEIIGTGFVVGDGIVATNDHVIGTARNIQAKFGLPRDEWPFEAVLFHKLSGKGMAQLTMRVLGAFTVESFETKGPYYGPDKPDIGLLHVDMHGLPEVLLKVDQSSIAPGARVATVGFPMGTRALSAPGYVHQLCPTLQEGIVSAVLPFPSSTPHAIMLNMMSQGGASGSPIFLPHTSEVIGVLYGGLNETYSLSIQGTHVPYLVPTNFTYCVPAHYLAQFLDHARTEPGLQHRKEVPDFNAIIDGYVAQIDQSSST